MTEVKEGCALKDTVEDRAVELGEYIVQNQATVRAAALSLHTLVARDTDNRPMK